MSLMDSKSRVPASISEPIAVASGDRGFVTMSEYPFRQSLVGNSNVLKVVPGKWHSRVGAKSILKNDKISLLKETVK